MKKKKKSKKPVEIIDCKTGIAIVGCGNIASFYLNTLPDYPELQLIGILDKDPERSARYSKYYSVPKYNSFDELLEDKRVSLVVNLTNPRSHFSVSKECLESGKHVYSEKPLAMSFEEAEQLVNLAKHKGLQISSAPSRILAETAQTMWKALREGIIGPVRLVYAEMDGGMIHRMRYRDWINELGIPWPYKDEFEVGCTIEHSGYSISWLLAFFGPVESVTAFSSLQIPDKKTDVPIEVNPPDFSIGCIKFKSGIVARLTSSWVAPADHSIRIFGDKGLLYTDDIWKPCCSVYIKKLITFKRKTMLTPWKKRYPLARPPGTSFKDKIHKIVTRSPSEIARSVRARLHHLKKRVDFCLGIAELAQAIQENRHSRLSAQFCLHTTEIMIAIHNAHKLGANYKIKTSFKPIDPMPWADGEFDQVV